MGATNTTTYYNLSQFIGTDKPAWLQDYNGDMLKIDTAINNAKTAADSAANAASAAQNDATTALGDITTINGNISTINTTLGTAVGNINTINSLIGNGTPTTTDQTIIGAINEINAEVTDMLSGYRIVSPNAIYSLTTDGVKTVKELLEDIASDFITNVVSNLTNNQRVLIRGISGFQIVGTAGVNTVPMLMSNATSSFSVPFYSCGYDGTDLIEYINTITDSASHSAKRENGTVTSRDSNVPANNLKYNIIYDLIEKG